MNILVLNVGSSSVKYAVFRDETLLLKGNKDRIYHKKGYLNAFNSIKCNYFFINSTLSKFLNSSSPVKNLTLNFFAII